MLQWTVDRTGKVARVNVAAFNVASGHDVAASSLAGMKLGRQVEKKRVLPCPTGGGWHILHGKNKTKPNPSESARTKIKIQAAVFDDSDFLKRTNYYCISKFLKRLGFCVFWFTLSTSKQSNGKWRRQVPEREKQTDKYQLPWTRCTDTDTAAERAAAKAIALNCLLRIRIHLAILPCAY